ncbi:hypothetical protein ACFU1R_26880 [Priestia megaterium]|uniref:hypothetical protein n=1 Tax=Priestia megaterium TaxID=1404 RepID=UPI0036728812
MKIKNHLNTEQLSHLEKMGKRKEKVNWKDIMGTNRQTWSYEEEIKRSKLLK